MFFLINQGNFAPPHFAVIVMSSYKPIIINIINVQNYKKKSNF